MYSNSTVCGVVLNVSERLAARPAVCLVVAMYHVMGGPTEARTLLTNGRFAVVFRNVFIGPQSDD